MKNDFLSRRRTMTAFVKLDTKKCEACWDCLEGCQNNVIGKVDLPWHRHALIIHPDQCSGCLRCMKTCKTGAFTEIDGRITATVKPGKKVLHHFIVNNLLLISGIAMILSGMILQLGYHIGGDRGTQKDMAIGSSRSGQYEQLSEAGKARTVYSLDYHEWSTTHKVAICLFSLGMVYHISFHIRWYKGVIKKHLIRRNLQVILLSGIFLLLAITGLVPWFIDLFDQDKFLRLLFIEIHDKIALIFIVYLVLHIIGRYRWFINVTKS